MKITRVETIYLRLPEVKFQCDSGQDALIVRVETDAGITGLGEVDSLVALLVQSDRFGTSVADSLRVHSDSLRTKRRLRAEEAAAKIAVKLLFPLIFCIFPASACCEGTRISARVVLKRGSVSIS